MNRSKRFLRIADASTAPIIKITAACLLLACVAPLLVSAQEAETGSEAGIRALEMAWTVGQSRNNSHALDLIFDNALVYVEYGKLVSKGEYLSRIKNQNPQQDEIVMGPMKVQTYTNTAIVVGTYSEKQTKTKKRGLEVRHWRFIDTWVYKESAWVLVAAAAVPVSASTLAGAR